MMKSFWFDSLRKVVATGAFVCLASAASAVTINFNVDRYLTSGTNTYTSEDGSVDVGVDGVRIGSNGTIDNTRFVLTLSRDRGGYNDGLGVYNCSLSNRCRDRRVIDGHLGLDMALLDFGEATVEITSVTFSAWDSSDTFAFGIYDDTGVGATPTSFETGIDEGDSNPFTYVFEAGQAVGSIFGFGADSSRDNFLLQSITLNVVSAVPLPAGALLILTSLGGLALMRRRRQVATA